MKTEIIEFGKWLIENVDDSTRTKKEFYWNENPSQSGWSMEDLYEHWKNLIPSPEGNTPSSNQVK